MEQDVVTLSTRPILYSEPTITNPSEETFTSDWTGADNEPSVSTASDSYMKRDTPWITDGTNSEFMERLATHWVSSSCAIAALLDYGAYQVFPTTNMNDGLSGLFPGEVVPLDW